MFERFLFILAVQLIWQPKGGHRIIHKRIHFTYIAGGWISGKIISPKRNSLFKQQSTSLVSLIKSCHFFTLSSMDTIHNSVMTNKGDDELIAYFAIFLLFWLVKGAHTLFDPQHMADNHRLLAKVAEVLVAEEPSRRKKRENNEHAAVEFCRGCSKSQTKGVRLDGEADFKTPFGG